MRINNSNLENCHQLVFLPCPNNCNYGIHSFHRVMSNFYFEEINNIMMEELFELTKFKFDNLLRNYTGSSSGINKTAETSQNKQSCFMYHC